MSCSVVVLVVGGWKGFDRKVHEGYARGPSCVRSAYWFPDMGGLSFFRGRARVASDGFNVELSQRMGRRDRL